MELSRGIKLSQLAAQIKKVLSDQFASRLYFVVAEVSNFSARKGIQYMQLIEKEEETGKLLAEIPTMIFQDSLHELDQFEQITGQRFGNGLRVLVQVAVTYHEVYGLKLVIHNIDPSFTIGELRRQRDFTLRKLCEENPDAVRFLNERYYTRNQTLPLPVVIHRIAVVSSEFSAGLQDFTDTLAKNHFGYHFETTLFSTKVQNDEQGKQIVERFIEIFHKRNEFDLVVLVRGGGSQTDLLMFDSYPLARAIARFPLPVFCGLGHLKDVSIADLMAHSSEKTPTRVAERIIAHNRQFEQQVLDIRNGLVIKSQKLIADQKEQMNAFSNTITQGSIRLVSATRQNLFNTSSLVSAGSISVIHNQASSLSSLSAKLSTKPIIKIGNAKNELAHLQRTVSEGSLKFIRFEKGMLQHHVTIFRLLSPEHTLARGFAVVKKEGKIITSADSVKKGDTIDILLGKQTIFTKVIDKKKENGNKNDL